METAATPPKNDTTVLHLIGAFRLFKAALLLVVGTAALRLMHHDVAEMARQIINELHIDPQGRYAEWMLSRITGLSPRRFAELGLGAFFYAALFTAEGVGLLMDQTWAEWLSVASTSILIPLEVYEVCRRFRATRVIVLILNIAIVIYLVMRLKGKAARRGTAVTSN